LGKAADRRQSEVYSSGGVRFLFKSNSVAGHHRLVEGQPRLRTIPVNELPDCVLYVRWEHADVRLFSTAVFDCSKSVNFRTDFGERLRFAERVFAIVAVLQRRNDSILSKPVSLDSSPFTNTYPAFDAADKAR
jgi:hypothetical protein